MRCEEEEDGRVRERRREERRSGRRGEEGEEKRERRRRRGEEGEEQAQAQAQGVHGVEFGSGLWGLSVGGGAQVWGVGV